MWDQEAIERVWNALLEVDRYLQHEFIEAINDSTAIEPAKWSFIHTAAAVLQAERPKLPAELYDIAWRKGFKQALEVNLNTFLDSCRVLILSRQQSTPDPSLEAQILQNIRDQLQTTFNDYRAALDDFRETGLRLLKEQESPSSPRVVNVFTEGGSYIEGDVTVGGDFVSRDKVEFDG
ncbi:MAG: hypothetical protein ACT4QE_14145 [Anaerolineales bacterium]